MVWIICSYHPLGNLENRSIFFQVKNTLKNNCYYPFKYPLNHEDYSMIHSRIHVDMRVELNDFLQNLSYEILFWIIELRTLHDRCNWRGWRRTREFVLLFWYLRLETSIHTLRWKDIIKWGELQTFATISPNSVFQSDTCSFKHEHGSIIISDDHFTGNSWILTEPTCIDQKKFRLNHLGGAQW